MLESNTILIKEISKRAKLEKQVFPHSLRGSFATILAGKGFDTFSIIRSMGWRNIRMADTYINLTPNMILKTFKEKW